MKDFHAQIIASALKKYLDKNKKGPHKETANQPLIHP